LAQAERRPVLRLAGDQQYAVVLALGALEQSGPIGGARRVVAPEVMGAVDAGDRVSTESA
jgi:hypothetical protein